MLEVIHMPDYQKLYTTLFNAITDALEELECANYGTAKQRLIRAQQDTEEMYLGDADSVS